MSEISVLNGYKIKDKKAIRFYDNVESMKADTTLKSGMLVETKGYYEPHDGGTAHYNIVNDKTLIQDNGAIIELANGLFAKLIVKDDTINIKQFGAIGDGTTDNNEVFTKVINYSKNKGLIIIVPKGVFATSNITIPSDSSGIQIIGTNKGLNGYHSLSCIKGIDESIENLITLDGQFSGGMTNRIVNFGIKNIRIDGNNIKKVGIACNNISNSTFENIEIQNCNDGILCDCVWDTNFNNIFIHQCGKSNTNAGLRFISTKDNNNNISIFNSRFESNSMHLILTKTVQTTITNTKFEDNDAKSRIDSTIYVEDTYGIKFMGCFFNATKDYPILKIKGVSSQFYSIFTHIIGCQFNTGDGLNGGKYIEFENANGGIIDDCSFYAPNLEGAIKMPVTGKLNNCSFYIMSSKGTIETSGIIEVANNSNIINNHFVCNMPFSDGSYLFKIADTVNNIILSNNKYSGGYINYKNITNYIPITSLEIQSYLSNVNITSTSDTNIINTLTSKFYTISSENMEITDIKNPYNGAVVTFYANTTGVKIFNKEVNAGEIVSYKYLSYKWFKV